MKDPSIGTSTQGGTLWDRVRSSPVDRAQLNGVNVVKTVLLYLYLLRCPIIALLIIWPGLYFGFQTSLLRGLADLQGGGKNGPILGVLTVSAVAFLAILAAVVAANLTLIYGGLRLFGTDATPANVPVNTLRRLYIFVPAIAIYVLFLLSLWPINVSQPDFDSTTFIGFAILGTFLAGIFVFAVNYVQLRFAHPSGQRVGAFLAIPFDLLMPWLVRFSNDGEPRGLLARAYYKTPPAVSDGGIVWKLFKGLFGVVGVGYVAFDEHRKPAFMLPGHLFAITLVALTLVAYVVTGKWEGSSLASASFGNSLIEYMPTIGWVLLALGLICWILSGLSFFFDRYRVPVLSVVAILLMLISNFGPTDHTFKLALLNRQQFNGLLTPTAVLAQDRFKDKLILVAAAGGGIQAAAWTARVLTGLQWDTRTDQAAKEDAKGKEYVANALDKSIAAISAVSGGSVGTLFYLRTLPLFPANRLTWLEAVNGAMESELESAAWGLTFPDFQRIAFPLLQRPDVDRGWALERSIAKHAQIDGVTLSSMGSAVRTEFPAVLFNSTMTQAAKPLVFSNTRFPTPLTDVPSLATGDTGFFDLCANHDVNVETAVRMSATFPWVSPAARPDLNCNADHLVDGGYYDTYGMSTLHTWVRQALTANEIKKDKLPPKKILIVRIVSFPNDKETEAPKEPWYYQVGVPILTMYNVRGESQGLGNTAQFWAVQSLLQTKGVEVQMIDFQFDPQDCECRAVSPPLSWHLMRSEINCIWKAWSEPRLNCARKTVKDFLESGTLAPNPCQSDGS